MVTPEELQRATAKGEESVNGMVEMFSGISEDQCNRLSFLKNKLFNNWHSNQYSALFQNEDHF